MRYLFYCVGISLLLGLGLSAHVDAQDAPVAQAVELRSPIPLPLPPNVELPSPYNPPTLCYSCGEGADRLRLMELDIVTHRIPLDTYRPDLTGDLLTIESGYNRKWNPAWQYTLHTRGLGDSAAVPGDGTLPAAILSHEAVLFRAAPAPTGGTAYVPVSRPAVTLAREGDALVVSRASDKKWYFSSYDNGNTWMLTKIESLRLPGQAVTLAYSGNNVREIVYPDGARAVLEYENDLVSRVVLPSGMYARIRRDANGWISSVGMYHPVHTVEKEVLQTAVTMTAKGPETTTWWRDAAAAEPGTFLYGFKYENDSNGRILRFENACGDIETVEYSRGLLKDGTMYLTVIRDSNDGGYRLMRHWAIGSIWRQAWAVGEKDTPLDQALIVETTTRQLTGHTWLKTAHWKASNGGSMPGWYASAPGVSVVPKSAGTAKSQASPPGAAAPDQAAAVRPPMSATSPDKAAPTAPVSSKPTYTYRGAMVTGAFRDGKAIWQATEIDDQNLIRAAIDANGYTWNYDYNSAHRMTVCRSPDGTRQEWEYDRFGEIVMVRQFSAPQDATPTAPATPAMETRHDEIVRDPFGRITQIDHPGENQDETAAWECGHLVRYTAAGGRLTVTYGYDSRGRLSRQTHSIHGQDRYQYNLQNQLVATGHRPTSDVPWVITRYTYDDHGRRLAQSTAAGEIRNIYTADGHTAGKLYPDGTREIQYYDARNRIIGVISPTRASFTVFKTPTGVDIAQVLRADAARAAIADWCAANPDLAATSEVPFDSLTSN